MAGCAALLAEGIETLCEEEISGLGLSGRLAAAVAEFRDFAMSCRDLVQSEAAASAVERLDQLCGQFDEDFGNAAEGLEANAKMSWRRFVDRAYERGASTMHKYTKLMNTEAVYNIEEHL